VSFLWRFNTLTNKWVKEILDALTILNGEGTLKEIYKEVSKTDRIDLSLFTDWKAQIRKNIYLHSSDCKIFMGVPGDENDLFFSVQGKGNGVWALRQRNQ
jgi:hypothetical protein